MRALVAQVRASSEKNGKEAPIYVTIQSTIYSFLLIFLALADQTLLLPNYLGNSFPQTEQLPKPELPSQSSLGWPLTRVLRLVSSWRPSSWTRWRGSPRGIPPPATWWTTASAPQMSRNWQLAKGILYMYIILHIASIGDSLVLHYLIVHVSRPQPWHDVESKQLYWEQLTGWCRNIYL